MAHRVNIFSVVGNASPVSRSEAKRIGAVCDGALQARFDFSGVESVGQGFADELFRVWPLRHPETKLVVCNANESVRRMISHVAGRTDIPQPAGKVEVE